MFEYMENVSQGEAEKIRRYRICSGRHAYFR